MKPKFNWETRDGIECLMLGTLTLATVRYTPYGWTVNGFDYSGTTETTEEEGKAIAELWTNNWWSEIQKEIEFVGLGYNRIDTRQGRIHLQNDVGKSGED
jgi:hypothetical protein